MKIGGLNQLYQRKSTEQNNMGRQILTEFQVNTLAEDILMDCLITVRGLLKQVEPDKELEDLENFDLAILTKIKAILCTVETAAYENIVKVVLDKLNLNDLFDNRQKYLN